MSSRVDGILSEIQAELRSIIRQLEDLRRPLAQFVLDESRGSEEPRYYVIFDASPRLRIRGLVAQIDEIALPDERILDAVLSLSKSVWQLKDRAKIWASASSAKVDVESEVKKCSSLLLCADLANWKKHGANTRRSGRNPRVELVRFDTSRSGVVEVYYRGDAKQKELIVTNPTAIHFSIDVTDGLGGPFVGEAKEILADAFRFWIDFCDTWQMLRTECPEAEYLQAQFASFRS